MRRHRAVLTAVAAALILGAVVPARADTPTEELRRYTDRVLAILRSPSLSARDKRAAVKQVTGEPLAIDNFVARKKAGERIAELRDFAAEVIAKGGFTNVSNQAMQIRLEALKLVVDGAQGRLF